MMPRKQTEIKSRFFFLVSLLSILTYVFLPTVRATELVISDNGSSSDNQVQLQTQSGISVSQSNIGEVSNNVASTASTGENLASGNTNGNVNISTGDTTTGVNIANSVNTSVVATGCCPSGTSAEISGNGSNSINQITVTQTSTTNVSVYQNASMTNNVGGYANTGNNNADKNTNGDVIITTGDVKVSSAIMNDPINISSVKLTTALANFAAKIADNGFGSENNVASTLNNQISIFTNFNARLNNNVYWDLNTGKNSADKNTDAKVNISTGDIKLDFFIRNLANRGVVEVICCPVEKEKEKEKPPIGGVPRGEEKKADGGAGQILPEAAAVEAGGPGVDRLAVTSSGETQALLFFIGLAMIAFGGKIATNELFQTTSRKKK